MERDNRRWHARKPQQLNQISSTTVGKRQPKKQETLEDLTLEDLNREIAKLKAILHHCQNRLNKAMRAREALWHS